MVKGELTDEKKALRALAKKYTRMGQIKDRFEGYWSIDCPVCNKRFIRVAQGGWAYKIQSAYFCSYSCMREAEDVIERAKFRQGRKKSKVL